ncbi:MAG: PASTA domain-containing protein [Myxococcales bacterium]|nr:PASTA domain-containing protein [Myxococcales bacterium]
MKNVDPARVRGLRIRMGLLSALLTAGLGIVLNGAYTVEVEDRDGWRSLAEKQRQRRLHITPKRGTIYDRNGTPLAVTVEVPSISVDAVEMLRGIADNYVAARVAHYAERVAEALSLPVAEVTEKLARRRRFAWLKRRVTPEEVEAVRALGDTGQRYPVRGLNVEGEGRRFYPNRELAGSVLGFVAPDGQGREGVELHLDEALRGRAEEIRGLRDRAGRLIFSEGIHDESALAGHDVHLTIDQSLQFIAERELAAALKTHEAKAGSIVVMDPNTGEILAMASGPGFNPNDYGNAEPVNRRNRAAIDLFEPGSTMKVFAMAAALASNSVKPDASIYCEEGHMPIDNVVIHDTHVSKWLSPTQILQVSSNIGIAKIALGLGEAKLHSAYRRFGFGEAPSLPLPGLAVGSLRPRARPWVPVETASAAFGQGVSVTNLQLALGLGALANEGRLLEPILVSKVTDSTGLVLTDATPKVRRRAVGPRASKLVGEMMIAVTEGEGTGIEAAIPGFKVAGKTATAQKSDAKTGRYDDTHFVASFIGYVPADKPKLVITVVIDEPMAGITSGGAVAAPVFRRVAELALRQMGVRPSDVQATNLVDVAALARNSDPAKGAYAALGDAADGARADGASNGGASNGGASKRSDEAAGLSAGESVRVPELEGLPVRAAIAAAMAKGFVPVVEGSGRVGRTEPRVGARVRKGSRLVLVFEPPT